MCAIVAVSSDTKTNSLLRKMIVKEYVLVTWFKYTILIVLLVLGVAMLLIVSAKYRDKSIQEQEAQVYAENISSFSAEEVVLSYFSFVETRNLHGLSLVLLETNYRKGDIRRDLNNLIYFDLLSIEKSENDEREFSAYLQNFFDIKIFIVVADIARKQEYGYSDGINEFAFVVVKETSESPWVIYSISKDI